MDASGAGGGCPPHVRRRHKLSRGHLRACGSPHSTAGFFADFAAARVVTASGADKTAQVRCPRQNFFPKGLDSIHKENQAPIESTLENVQITSKTLGHIL